MTSSRKNRIEVEKKVDPKVEIVANLLDRREKVEIDPENDPDRGNRAEVEGTDPDRGKKNHVTNHVTEKRNQNH